MEILTSPVKAIAKAKKEKNLGKSIGVLVVAALLFAIATAIGMIPISGLAQIGAESAVGIFFLVLVGGLFLGWIVKIVMTTLGGVGKYFEGLTAVAYSSLPISIGMVIASIASVTLAQSPVAGMVVSFVFLAIFGALGLAILYRAVKDLFRTDMITTLLGVSIVYLAMFTAIYGSAVWGLTGLFSTLISGSLV